MSHFAGKILRSLMLSAVLTILLAVTALAADISIGVGATTGSSLRMRSEPSTSSAAITHNGWGV